MTQSEIDLIKSKWNAAIIAPAGHGKTEMVAELVGALEGVTLVLTHTNAGVDALSMRMKGKKVAPRKYRLSTIASFCMRWTEAYPHSSGIDVDLNVESDAFHKDREKGALRLFEKSFAKEILAVTYDHVIIDEYQDCTQRQHEVFLEMNKVVPAYVFGDPMQAIFGWNDVLVSWDSLEFERVEVETRPWRWDKTNRELGEYLTETRDKLEALHSAQNKTLKIESRGDYIQRIPTKGWQQFSGLISLVRKYDSVLYISRYPSNQAKAARYSGGALQNDEPQNLKDLYGYARSLDNGDNKQKAQALFEFIEKSATGVSEELKSYKKHIMGSGDFDFNRISKHPQFGESMAALHERGSLDDMVSALSYIKGNGLFKIYRLELFEELTRSIRMAKEKGIAIEEAAWAIRTNPKYRRGYSRFKKISSRTVLSKGLEFECVVIDTSAPLTVNDMYVAMTRATRMIYVIAESGTIALSGDY